MKNPPQSSVSQSGLACIGICSGAGGRAIGLERAEFKEVPSDQWEGGKVAYDVVEGDVRDFAAKEFEGVDLRGGGVPCPPFSKAGKNPAPMTSATFLWLGIPAPGRFMSHPGSLHYFRKGGRSPPERPGAGIPSHGAVPLILPCGNAFAESSAGDPGGEDGEFFPSFLTRFLGTRQ